MEYHRKIIREFQGKKSTFNQIFQAEKNRQ